MLEIDKSLDLSSKRYSANMIYNRFILFLYSSNDHQFLLT